MRSILVFLFVLYSAVLSAQYGSVKGTLMNRRFKEPIVCATLVFEDSIRKGTMTDLDGIFFLDSLPAGVYSVRVKAIGEGDSTYTNIHIYADSTVTLNLELPQPCKYDDHAHDRTCPNCKSKKHVLEIFYGLPVGERNTKKYYYAGCQITYCDPYWYCEKCDLKF